jgi:predicted transcriptional regulator
MISKINTRIKLNKTGLFHNSREDVASLSKVCNLLINKVNELTDEINAFKRDQK